MLFTADGFLMTGTHRRWPIASRCPVRLSMKLEVKGVLSRINEALTKLDRSSQEL